MLEIINRNQFKRDYRKADRRGKVMQKLIDVIAVLANEEQLDQKYQDHPLKGDYVGMRECHIEPDWLLVYVIAKKQNELRLVRIGTHADLFGE